MLHSLADVEVGAMARLGKVGIGKNLGGVEVPIAHVSLNDGTPSRGGGGGPRARSGRARVVLLFG
jgi:hypothetical protein